MQIEEIKRDVDYVHALATYLIKKMDAYVDDSEGRYALHVSYELICKSENFHLKVHISPILAYAYDMHASMKKVSSDFYELNRSYDNLHKIFRESISALFPYGKSEEILNEYLKEEEE